MKYDFHVHSNFSDSNISFSQDVEIALSKNIDYLGIVDHDTLLSIQTAQDKQYQLMDMTIIGGVEISCFDYTNKKNVHMIGYGCDTSNYKLNNLIDATRSQRNQSFIESFKIINSKRLIHINIDELKTFLTSDSIYKPPTINYLKSKDYDLNPQGEIYNHLFGKNGYIKINIQYPSFQDAINAIRCSGGIPVLAHPFVYNNFADINEFFEAGIMGIEAGHPSNDTNRENTIIKYCQDKDLFITCGSDYHGDFGERGSIIGDCSLDDEIMAPFIDKLKSIKAI